MFKNQQLGNTITLVNGNQEYIIPYNMSRISYTPYNPWGKSDELWEIDVCDSPAIGGNIEGYGLVKDTGIEEQSSYVDIKYFNKHIQKLYKINDGEWVNYNNSKIELEIDDTVYAKGIDKYGKESDIVSDTRNQTTDALGKEAYDKDMTTIYPGGWTKSAFLKVDPSAWGKTLTFNFNGGYHYIVAYVSKNEGELNWINSQGGDRDNTNIVTIPENTTIIRVYFNEGGGLYEIQVSD